MFYIGSSNLVIDQNHHIKMPTYKTVHFDFKPIENVFLSKNKPIKLGSERQLVKMLSLIYFRLPSSYFNNCYKTYINKSIELSIFPGKLKEAHVVPVH